MCGNNFLLIVSLSCVHLFIAQSRSLNKNVLRLSWLHHFNNTWSLCLIEISNIYINNTSFPEGAACSKSFNQLSGQRTHRVSGDQIGRSLSLWQIPGTQRSWMKRCRTPRGKEMEERHFMCHIWGLQKSVSSKCQQLVRGENEISCQRSWEALLWLTFNMTLFRSAAQTQCHSHRCHKSRRPHEEYFTFHDGMLCKHSWGETCAHNRAQRYTVTCFFF